MTWTRTPPKTPGRCRFLPAPGIDREPFEVELVEDTINGGVVVRDRHGLCVRIENAYQNCEWDQSDERTSEAAHPAPPPET